MDLTANVLPIAEYVEDRSEMISQMVSALRVPILRKLLPATLKRIPLDELKEVLLHELSSIPRKDVLDSLAGKWKRNVELLVENILMRVLSFSQTTAATYRSRNRSAACRRASRKK